MPVVQSRLPLGMPFRPRTRNVRRPFTPSFNDGPYRLPRDVRDRLALALAPFRNREAAFALATFLGRFWSIPHGKRRTGLPEGLVPGTFPIDRCKLANHPELGLTEGRIRGAIRVLEEIGFIDRALTSGSSYRLTDEGLQRKPVFFVFGSEYAPLFSMARNRDAAARERDLGSRRSQVLVSSHRASTGSVEARESVPSSERFQPLKLPEGKSAAESSVLTGKLVKGGIPPSASESDPKLEAALDRLLQGIRQSRGGCGDGSAR
jgi:hypothetical protein